MCRCTSKFASLCACGQRGVNTAVPVSLHMVYTHAERERGDTHTHTHTQTMHTKHRHKRLSLSPSAARNRRQETVHGTHKHTRTCRCEERRCFFLPQNAASVSVCVRVVVLRFSTRQARRQPKFKKKRARRPLRFLGVGRCLCRIAVCARSPTYIKRQKTKGEKQEQEHEEQRKKKLLVSLAARALGHDHERLPRLIDKQKKGSGFCGAHVAPRVGFQQKHEKRENEN